MSTVTAVPLQPVKRSYKVWLWLGVIAAIALAAAGAWYGTRTAAMAAMTNEQFLDWNKTRSGVKVTPAGVQYEVLKEGEGAPLADGQGAYVAYEGRLRDGKLFDKSREPVMFPVMQGATVPGFYDALKVMKKGGEYRIWIPAELGYGERTPDPNRLPPNSILVFKMTIDRVLSQQEMQAMIQQMMMQRQMQGGGGMPGQ